MQSEPRTPVSPGDEVSVTYDPARIHLFDAETGEAIFHAGQDGAERTRVAPERQ
jgi:multiple sugar transport system ATP-binding protein